MAKELPYFKFEPNQWENGNIQMLSREDKVYLLIYVLCIGQDLRCSFKTCNTKVIVLAMTALKSLCDENN